MKTVALKDLFEEKIQPKYYYKTKRGNWVVSKNKEYYFSSTDKKEVEQVVELLKQCNWDKTQLPRIKKELKIVKRYSTNKTGFYRVSLRKDNEKGYSYIYEFLDEYKIHTKYSSKSLRLLREKVLKKGMVWKPLTADAMYVEKFLVR